MNAAPIAEILETIVERLVTGMSPTRIFLFGSHAYGTPDPGSDLDLMVVVSNSELPPHRRAQFAYRLIGVVGMAKDLVVLTEEEFARQMRRESSLARVAVEEGRILYERREAA